MLKVSDAVLTIILISGALGFQMSQIGNESARRMIYAPGIHLVELSELKRQFLLAVPHELASNGRVPLVVTFHGFSDSPWYVNRATDMSTWLDRYGWLGIFPFGLDFLGTNGLDGIRACCPSECDDECCKNGEKLRNKDHTACGWLHHEADREFTRALVSWAEKNVMADTTKVFATGFSNGAQMAASLYCTSADLFRVIAPISGDKMPLACQPARPVSYVSMCGSIDDEAICQDYQKDTAELVSSLNSCQGPGLEEKMSATTTCKKWSMCQNGTFVEWCESVGLSHDPSGHLRPDNTSYLRPGSDLDFTEYMMMKFSLFAEDSILFYGQPTSLQLEVKQSSWPPPTHDDHIYLRQGRLLGHDRIE